MQTVSALLSWSHNKYLFDKTRTLDEYLWYATQTIENRRQLTIQALWHKLIIGTLIMNKTVSKRQTKKNSLRLPAIRKRAIPPFADKIPFIRSLILDSVQTGTIKKIFLFGSYAYGNPTKKSDIDLCVVIDNNVDRKNIFMDISMKLLENNIVNFDLLVYKKEIFYNVENKDSVENTIIEKGIILYE